jgi:hypothetical protein
MYLESVPEDALNLKKIFIIYYHSTEYMFHAYASGCFSRKAHSATKECLLQ